MGIVANGASFMHGFMLKDKRPGLVLVTLLAALVLSRHRQAARRFKNVAAVRIMAVHATHMAFKDGMMLRQIEFGLDIQMALEAGVRLFAGINDEVGRATGTDMFAAGAVAGFATAFPAHGRVFNMQTGVRAGRKFTDDFRMAISGGMVAHYMRPGNLQRRNGSG